MPGKCDGHLDQIKRPRIIKDCLVVDFSAKMSSELYLSTFSGFLTSLIILLYINKYERMIKV